MVSKDNCLARINAHRMGYKITETKTGCNVEKWRECLRDMTKTLNGTSLESIGGGHRFFCAGKNRIAKEGEKKHTISRGIIWVV